MIRVSDYIMMRLAHEGVGHVFQVTGRGSLFLNDALAKRSDLKAVSLHHEQSCSYAAVAYAEQTNGLGACLVSTGCAATNAMTGLLSAWQDGIPCIFISGQNVLSETSRYTGIPLRSYGQQEADIISLVTPITKYAKMITKPDDIVVSMHESLKIAQSGRKGPVWLDIPLDIQSALISSDYIELQNLPAPKLISFSARIDISPVVNSLLVAERPVVLIGSGIRSAGAEAKLINFIEKFNIPLVYTSSAPDIYGSSNLLSIGSVGAMGCSRAGNFTVQNSDFLLILGSRLNSLTTGPDFCKFGRGARIAVVDIDKLEHSKAGVNIDIFIESDLSVFFDAIEKEYIPKTNSCWVEKCLHWKDIFGVVEPEFKSHKLIDLYQLAEEIGRLLPKPSTLVTDSGLVEVILPTNIRFAPLINCIHPVSQGAMGFALPAAIGAQLGKSHPVITVIGDGSIMMNLQELESIRYLKLPIKIIVINNNVYSIIRRRQRDLFRSRTIGTDSSNGISCPDFQQVASCFGLHFIRINSYCELQNGLTKMLSFSGPVMCEIMCRPDQEYIELGLIRRESDRRLTRRPLEDQKPFISRDLFLSEMIIDPIDQ